VDNDLERLPRVGITSFVRAGGEDGAASAFAATRCPGGEEHLAFSVEALRDLADTCAVVGATCYAAANHPIITRRRPRRAARSDSRRPGEGLVAEAPREENEVDRKEDAADGTDGYAFDVVLVDEAGQMTLPASLPPLLRGSVFVLVGDPNQLPPLVQSESAALGGLATSPMQTLAAAHPFCVSELRAQYRMADDLAKISNVISYAGRLRAANDEIANRVLHLHAPPSVVAPDAPAWVLAATDPQKRVVMLDTSDFGAAAYETSGESEGLGKAAPGAPRGRALVNAFERGILMEVLRALHARGAAPGSCAVLSPYNAQVDALASDLQKRRHGSRDIPENVEALTIDRAQGRDVDCVLISFCRANEKRDAGALLSDRRRLNVALTRARCKLILVGHGATLAQSPVLREVLGVVLSERWLIPLSPSATSF
jgi:DNA replication ATP-dependent helicase Dna2